MKLNIGERFWSKVDKSAGPIGCWPWTAGGSVYGNFWDGDQYSPAHRVAFLLDGGVVTSEKPDVLHKCHEFGFPDNKRCCNPLHLKSGSPTENARDSVRNRSHRNSRKTNCNKGHELTIENIRVEVNSKGGRSRRCLICERAFLNSPGQKAYRAKWWREKKAERDRLKPARKPRVEYHQKTTPRPVWPAFIAPDLQVGRTDHPLAQPIFHPDGTVFIPLSKAAWRGMYAKIDFDDFEAVNNLRWTAWWGRTPGSFYATSGDGKKNFIYMNRLLLGLTDRNARGEYVSEDTLDNRRANLKVTAQRWQLRAGNTSGHPGVYWDKSRGKWAARLQLKGVGNHLGRFLLKEDAIAAYRDACVKMGIEIHA